MITIRYEKMGIIIWSDVEKKYFLQMIKIL